MSKTNKTRLKVIPLGGMEEIGKNMTIFEYGDDIMLLDCGLAFPENEMLGIDLVIPDITYLEINAEKLKGIVVTHGHEDHIGALPFVLRKVKAPIYGTDLALGLIENKLIEHEMLDTTELIPVKAGQKITLGVFKVEFIRSTHSIADTVMVAIETPVGVVFHTADFKIDHTPIEGEPIDFQRIAEIGRKGVLLMLADSTNVERPGYTISERKVGESFDNIFRDATSRILVASFASNIHRLQQVFNSAKKYGRKVAICGRSMINVTKTALKLGYLHIPEEILIDLDRVKHLPPEQVVIITTGSQGEPMSALTRIANGSHRQVELNPGDLVILSASPIPGNEKFVYRVINELYKKGATVLYDSLAEIHVSGHACQEELKIIHRLVQPKFFIPVHGEYRHLRQHSDLAITMGIPEENIFIMSNGQVLEFSNRAAHITGTIQSGSVLVDGLGVGDLGDVVLKDRKLLSEDGLIIVVVTLDANKNIVSGPEVLSRGFVYVNESEEMMEDIIKISKDSVLRTIEKRKGSWDVIKNALRDDLGSHLYRKTMRKPMILPIVIEVPTNKE